VPRVNRLYVDTTSSEHSEQLWFYIKSVKHVSKVNYVYGERARVALLRFD